MSMAECDFIGCTEPQKENIQPMYHDCSGAEYETLDKLSKRIHAANAAKGFYDDEAKLMEEVGAVAASIAASAFKMQRVALIHSELSEAVEAERKYLMDDHLPQYQGFDVELADALIRILDMAGAYRIPIGDIVKAKLEYNATRPFKHGKSC